MGMPVIKPSEVTREQAISDIIESVALQEAALAHILNAEGEKIQKAVATPGITPDQLLAVNKSVQTTISAVTKLEMVLQSKLELFSCVICK